MLLWNDFESRWDFFYDLHLAPNSDKDLLKWINIPVISWENIIFDGKADCSDLVCGHVDKQHSSL